MAAPPPTGFVGCHGVAMPDSVADGSAGESVNQSSSSPAAAGRAGSVVTTSTAPPPPPAGGDMGTIASPAASPAALVDIAPPLAKAEEPVSHSFPPRLHAC
jgi:hypothetical protein